MIHISGMDINEFDPSALTPLQRSILQKKKESPITYRYDSPDALLFELTMRSYIVEEARALYASRAGFATFQHSRANDRYWSRTDNGGFRQKADVLPSDAITNIFEEGRLYAFECATAMVIILYKATLDAIGKTTFNAYFKDLLLYDWNYDSDLRFITVENEAYPGDVLYVKNPDYDPSTPEWQGENVIPLADNLYYGHGIGIGAAEKFITELNRRRRPDSTTSAYLMTQADHPDFNYLHKLPQTVVARIGTRSYVFPTFREHLTN